MLKKYNDFLFEDIDDSDIEYEEDEDIYNYIQWKKDNKQFDILDYLILLSKEIKSKEIESLVNQFEGLNYDEGMIIIDDILDILDDMDLINIDNYLEIEEDLILYNDQNANDGDEDYHDDDDYDDGDDGDYNENDN